MIGKGSLCYFLKITRYKTFLQQIFNTVLNMNKQIAVALLTLLTFATIYLRQTNKTDQFQQWKDEFGQNFDDSEEVYRRLIFQKNVRQIQSHNSDPSQTYKMGINQFTIYSTEQFKERFLSEMIIPDDINSIDLINDQEYEPNVEIDWSAKGKVSRIKNQGSCGACWAFAALASCQSYGLMNGKSVDLSEQQLVDCSSSYGNKACQGGWPSWALKYVKDRGVTSQTAYPYVTRAQTCKQNGGTFKITSYTTISNTCSAVSSAIAQRPVAVTIDATNWSRYSSGVFSNCNTSLNHAVLLVGIVSGSWKIKNSWGAGWGQSGYMRIAQGNTCGICQAGGSYAI